MEINSNIYPCRLCRPSHHNTGTPARWEKPAAWGSRLSRSGNENLPMTPRGGNKKIGHILWCIITCVTVLPPTSSKIKLWSESFGVGSPWTPKFHLKIEFNLKSQLRILSKKPTFEDEETESTIILCTAAIFWTCNNEWVKPVFILDSVVLRYYFSVFDWN